MNTMKKAVFICAVWVSTLAAMSDDEWKENRYRENMMRLEIRQKVGISDVYKPLGWQNAERLKKEKKEPNEKLMAQILRSLFKLSQDKQYACRDKKEILVDESLDYFLEYKDLVLPKKSENHLQDILNRDYITWIEKLAVCHDPVALDACIDAHMHVKGYNRAIALIHEFKEKNPTEKDALVNVYKNNPILIEIDECLTHNAKKALRNQDPEVYAASLASSHDLYAQAKKSNSSLKKHTAHGHSQKKALKKEKEISQSSGSDIISYQLEELRKNIKKNRHEQAVDSGARLLVQSDIKKKTVFKVIEKSISSSSVAGKYIEPLMSEDNDMFLASFMSAERNRLEHYTPLYNGDARQLCIARLKELSENDTAARIIHAISLFFDYKVTQKETYITKAHILVNDLLPDPDPTHPYASDLGDLCNSYGIYLIKLQQFKEAEPWFACAVGFNDPIACINLANILVSDYQRQANVTSLSGVIDVLVRGAYLNDKDCLDRLQSIALHGINEYIHPDDRKYLVQKIGTLPDEIQKTIKLYQADDPLGSDGQNWDRMLYYFDHNEYEKMNQEIVSGKSQDNMYITLFSCDLIKDNLEKLHAIQQLSRMHVQGDQWLNTLFEKAVFRLTNLGFEPALYALYCFGIKHAKTISERHQFIEGINDLEKQARRGEISSRSFYESHVMLELVDYCEQLNDCAFLGALIGLSIDRLNWQLNDSNLKSEYIEQLVAPFKYVITLAKNLNTEPVQLDSNRAKRIESARALYGNFPTEYINRLIDSESFKRALVLHWQQLLVIPECIGVLVGDREKSDLYCLSNDDEQLNAAFTGDALNVIARGLIDAVMK